MAETLTPGWFAGVVDDLAAEAVRGVRVDVVPLVAGPPPSLAQTYVTQFDEGYPEVLSRIVDRHLRSVWRDRERRERNTAMLLWGVHL